MHISFALRKYIIYEGQMVYLRMLCLALSGDFSCEVWKMWKKKYKLLYKGKHLVRG